METEDRDRMPPSPPFRDRREAGVLLARSLRAHRGRDGLVLGIPRGGVVVAAEVTGLLGADLDVIVACKLGAPGHAELAIGAVTASGERLLNEILIRRLQVSKAWVEAVTAREIDEARRRQERYRAGRAPRPVAGRRVIVVDDGLATGATMRAAVREILREGPEQLIVAAPVGSPAACRVLAEEAHEVVCPWAPEAFGAVGDFYVNFEPIEDLEVERILREFEAGRSDPRGGREASGLKGA